MKDYKLNEVRNVVLLGHGGTGKTTLTEAMLKTAGAISKMGNVSSKNTISDFDDEEKNSGHSISTSVIPIELSNHKYNILDTPGYFDFIGEVFTTVKVASGAVIVVDADSGVEIGTEKAWKFTEKRNIPRMIFVNKMDKENIHYGKLMKELKDKLGKKVAPFAIPLGESKDFKGFINVVDYKARSFNGTDCVDVEIPEEAKSRINPIREMLIESVAESDEALLEKFFEGEEFTIDEIHKGLRKGVLTGEVVPVIIGAAEKQIGVHTLLDMIYDYLPTPKDMYEGHYDGTNPKNNEREIRDVDINGPLSALVFKTISDPFLGKISIFKVISGCLEPNTEIYNASQDEYVKIGSLYHMRGNKPIDAEHIVAGDIGAAMKLEYSKTGDTFCDPEKPIVFDHMNVPKPCMFKAVKPKSRKDEEKISDALHKLLDEDPAFTMKRNKETKQLLIGGQGLMHLNTMIQKLENRYNVNVDLIDQKIAYKETITTKSDVQGKHKKQSGGSGQYGDVHIRFEPAHEEFIFEEEIYGGAVPKSYIPAVEKGLLEAVESGVLAGFPVTNIKATLHDGSYHDVDSSEMAFKTAAKKAFKVGIQQANPVLLEPIMHIEIYVPEVNMGDIMGDMNKRRGRILGMEPDEFGFQKVIAEAPEAELFTYASDLRSMTQARGYFSMTFDRYERVPSDIAKKVIAKANSEE